MGDISRLSGETSAEFVDLARRVFGLELVEDGKQLPAFSWVAKLPSGWVSPWASLRDSGGDPRAIGDEADSVIVEVWPGEQVLVSLFNSVDDDLDLWGDWIDCVPTELVYVDEETSTVDAFETCLYRLGFYA